ncbi:putative transcription factor WD40-like family [Helianthus anomalus]
MKHNGPIFSVKWNKKGDCVLTGGFDRSGVVWDINTNKLIQQFDFHSGAILYFYLPNAVVVGLVAYRGWWWWGSIR